MKGNADQKREFAGWLPLLGAQTKVLWFMSLLSTMGGSGGFPQAVWDSCPLRLLTMAQGFR